MNRNTKIILIGLSVIAASAAVYIISQDRKRKRYANTVVSPDYALSLINKK